MSAWDDPITHIRELEAEVSRLRKVVARVEEIAANYEADAAKEDYGGELWSTTATHLRSALEDR